METKPKDDVLHAIVAWVSRDFFAIAILLFALLACAYTIYTATSYQQAINDHWELQWAMSGCAHDNYLPANITFNLLGDYHASQDYD